MARMTPTPAEFGMIQQSNPLLDDELRRQMAPGGSPTFNERGPAMAPSASSYTAGLSQGQLPGGRAIDYEGLQRDYGWDRDRTNQVYGSFAGLADDSQMGARGQAAAAAGGGGPMTFGGKNWEGGKRKGGGGAFAGNLEGFDANKLGDVENTIGDSNTSKYWFANFAQNYDPRDPSAIEKIIADAKAAGLNWQYDGKDGIDFGDGYGWIDVSRAWEAGKGGQGWVWQPKGQGGTAAAGGGGGAFGGGATGATLGAAFPGVSSGQSQMEAIQAEIDRILQRKQPNQHILDQMIQS